MRESRAAREGVTASEVEQEDFAPGSGRGNAVCRMVDAEEICSVTAFLASDKAWAVTGEAIAAGGGPCSTNPPIHLKDSPLVLSPL